MTTIKYDPVKVALDFLNSSSVDQNKHISISDNDTPQEPLHTTSSLSSSYTSSFSNDDESLPTIEFMIRLTSVKIITVKYPLSKTMDEVKNEIEVQFGLSPSHYILKAG